MTPESIFDVDALRRAVSEGWRPRYVCFWGHTPKTAGVGKHVLSQWWPADFRLADQTYSSAEQYMMAEKARLFGDDHARGQILATSNPRKVKAIGRTIANFDEAVWRRERFDIVVRGSCAKFGQNAELRRYLLETGDKVLVEASPMDSIWGIGLAGDDPAAERPQEWPGLNLLGFALMRARSTVAQQSA